MKLSIKLFLFLLFVAVLAHAENLAERKKKVLVLHSYHQGLDWTDNITRGIKSVFDPLESSYEIHYEYLDTKRNTGDAYMQDMARFVSEKNSKIQFEAIIASDNNALQLLNEGKLVFGKSPPVIFCGINNYEPSLTDHIAKVTGVAETNDYRGTIDLMRRLHPNRTHVLVVLDRTPTGNAIREEFRRFEDLYKGQLEFRFMRDFSLDEVPDKVAHLDDNDIIYILTFNRDKNDNFISYTEGIEMISRSTDVPIYGSWDFYLGKGIVGGSITSGFLQGEEAAKMAVRVLQGYQIENMKVLLEGASQFMFDYKYLKKYGIDPSQLPKGSTIINAPPSTFERHKLLLTWVTGISLGFMLLLLWKYMRQRVVLKEEIALAMELEKKVQERTRELAEKNRELRRLSNLDGLTQLHNRRYFDEVLIKEINRLQRASSPISLLICDIDFFKQYNDTYGHLAGDDCIKIVANAIQQNCRRATDVAARYGGEEFGIILPGASPEDACRIAESIHKGIELQNIAHESSTIKNIISISIGIASIIPDAHTTPASLIAIADKALYVSKSSGRDRVTLLQSL